MRMREKESPRNVVVVSPASPSSGHAGHVAWSVVAGLVFESPEFLMPAGRPLKVAVRAWRERFSSSVAHYFCY